MKKYLKKFMKESGMKRIDKDWISVPESSDIYLREGQDCTPAQLLKKIVNSGKNKRRIEISNLLNNPL
jgi:hypothetical protein